MLRSFKGRILVGVIAIVTLTNTVLMLLNNSYSQKREKIDDISYNIQLLHNNVLRLINGELDLGSNNMMFLENNHHNALVATINILSENINNAGKKYGIDIQDDIHVLLRKINFHDSLHVLQDSLNPDMSREMIMSHFNSLESLIMGINTKVAFKKDRMYSALKLNYSIILITTILITFIISIVFSKMVTKPFLCLSNHISNVVKSRFKLKEKLDMKNASTELKNINLQFNDLINQLNRHIEKQNRIMDMLKTERKHYQQLADLLPLGVFELNDEGTIIYANKYFKKKFRMLTELDVEYKLTRFIKNENDVRQIETNENIDAHEFVARDLSNNCFNALLSMNKVKSGDNMGGERGFVLDISGRVKYIEALKREKKRAEESDKLKSAFLANVSHEIRTPLNGILGFSELLANVKDLEKRDRKMYFTQIKENSDLLLNIINDLIDFAKIEAGRIEIKEEMVNVDKTVNEVFDHFNFIINKTKPELYFTLNKKCDGNIEIISDKNRLKQVLINLIGNAIKFTNKGGVSITYCVQDNLLNIVIKDTGIGIEENKQQLIFEPFRQAEDSINRNFGGTGLGLSITKQIIEYLGGVITVNSKFGFGSEFIVKLPIISVEETSKRREVETRKNYYFDGSTILIVDDKESCHELLYAILEPTGAKIIKAYNGEESIETIRNNPSVDLVLMDMNMPKIDGLKAARLIREINKDIPIVIQSAYAIQTGIEDAGFAGCDDYITKPINREELLDKINFHLLQKTKIESIDLII